MATVQALTAERTLQIENKTVVTGYVDNNGTLKLETRDGDIIDAGYVQGSSTLVNVNHGSDPTTTRPNSVLVHWIGVATPANALPHDFWTAVNLPE